MGWVRLWKGREEANVRFQGQENKWPVVPLLEEGADDLG